MNMREEIVSFLMFPCFISSIFISFPPKLRQQERLLGIRRLPDDTTMLRERHLYSLQGADRGLCWTGTSSRMAPKRQVRGQGGISSSVLSVFFTDKFALSQSDARISVAYKICQWKTLTKRLMKCAPGLNRQCRWGGGGGGSSHCLWILHCPPPPNVAMPLPKNKCSHKLYNNFISKWQRWNMLEREELSKNKCSHKFYNNFICKWQRWNLCWKEKSCRKE